ncbi:RsmD family RNA methyltransferase [Candidatus Pacearchaeota archaeon]|nr:RsmD family RNA methyltransferase [Candidatus Pacearchaeota archaeon]
MRFCGGSGGSGIEAVSRTASLSILLSQKSSL